MLNCQDEKAGFEGFFQLLDEFQQRDKSYLVKDGIVGQITKQEQLRQFQ